MQFGYRSQQVRAAVEDEAFKAECEASAEDRAKARISWAEKQQFAADLLGTTPPEPVAALLHGK